MDTPAAWVQLIHRSMEAGRNAPTTKFVQLATLTKNGLPSVRTVVFRGWLSGNSLQPVMKFVSDLRSEKFVGLLHRENWAEVCWYFQESRDQFRLRGILTAVGADALDGTDEARARLEQWRDLSDAARLQFCFPRPGDPRPEQNAARIDPFHPPQPSPMEPVPTFGLLLFCPTLVDHYSARRTEREIYTARTGQDRAVVEWIRSRVNP
jgi:pyridoxamine 5'-phosphate oxidase